MFRLIFKIIRTAIFMAVIGAFVKKVIGPRVQARWHRGEESEE